MSSVNKKYKCNYCDKKFAHTSSKYRHQRLRCKSKQPVINNVKTVDNNSDKIDKIMDKLEKLEDKIYVNDSTSTNITNIQNNNITIYVTDKVDFLKILTERRFLGDETKAINYFKDKIAKNLEGDLDVFCDIYLQGPSDEWSVMCQDPNSNTFLIKDNENNIIQDPGGIKLYKNFKTNYTNTLLKLSSKEINNVVDTNVNSTDFQNRMDYLLDDFDLSMMQNKVFYLLKSEHITFMKKLKLRMNYLGAKSNIHNFIH